MLDESSACEDNSVDGQICGRKRQRKDQGVYEPLWKTVEKSFQLREETEVKPGSNLPRKLTRPISPNLKTEKRIKVVNSIDQEMTLDPESDK